MDPKSDVLAEIEAMPIERAAECRQIIEEMEEQGRFTLKLMPGAAEVFQWLSQHGIPTALVTRNTLATVNRLEQLLPPIKTLDIAIPRDYSEGPFPPKPDPASLHFIVQQWKTQEDPTTVVMVGDSPSHDVGFGKAAGTTTALLDTGRRHSVTEAVTASDDDDAHTPDFLVRRLWELPRLLWLHRDVPGALGGGGGDAPRLKYDAPAPSTDACAAAARGDVATLRTMSDGDVLAACPHTGNTPLIWAADAGHVRAVEHVLTRVGDGGRTHWNARGYLGATAVSRAACRGHAACLRLLAEAGANVDICNDKMQYPLHFAAFKEHTDCLAVLLEFGANTLVLDRKGRTPSLDTKNEEIRRILEDAMPL